MEKLSKDKSREQEEQHKQEVRELGRKSLIHFGNIFLKEDFSKSESPEIHHIAGKSLLDRDLKRVCNILPRGWAKTTLQGAAILYRLCYNVGKDRDFIALISESQAQAKQRLGYIKSHLESNEKIRYYFGDLVDDKKWTEADIITARKDRIVALGAGQKVRGRQEKGLRYTIISADDIESESNTKTKESRKFLNKWFKEAVIPAVDVQKGEIWLSGTIVHYGSLLQEVLDKWRKAQEEKQDSIWHVNFHVAEIDGKSTWESYYPMSYLRDRREELGRTSYAQEYLNEARDPSTAIFMVEKINYCDYELVTQRGFNYIIKGDQAIPVTTHLGVDMAYGAGEDSDFQVILPLHMDAQKNIYIGEYYHAHSSLYELPDKIVSMARQNNAKLTNVEQVGAQVVIKEAVQDMEKRDSKAIRGATVGVKPPTGVKKEDKLEAGLSHYVNRGKLYMQEWMDKLYEELWHFPAGKHDDLLDGMWLALQRIKPPKSQPFPKEQLDSMAKEPVRIKKKRINWMTNQPF